MARARYICRSSRPGPARTGAPLWRLVGANNRELGRAPEAVAGEGTCCEAVLALQAKLPDASGRVKLAGTANTWSWTVECDGELLAVSGRAYLRQRECQYSLWQFLAAAAVATVAASAEHSGPHLCAQ
ncbi:hypothetical protein [Catenulispora subtropica]|uniref:DUF1508 domain-containing protein n=1 Tax=Catenulispora subtropica TaxID=450798 RepID=A0ABN2QD46_9ACTN